MTTRARASASAPTLSTSRMPATCGARAKRWLVSAFLCSLNGRHRLLSRGVSGRQSLALLVLQKIHFFLCGLPSQGLVSRGESSESPDCFQMLLCVLQLLGLVWLLCGQRAGKPYRLKLIVQIFAMFERKVKEHPHKWRQLAVISRCYRVTA